MKNIIKYLFLGLFGGITYYCVELLWRGYSRWTMAILGSVIFILIGNINSFLEWTTPLWKQCAIATVIITVLEFITGCIVNLWLCWNVWNYTVLDVLGQISLPFIGLWYVLSIVGIFLDDIIRWKFFNEQKPHYTIF
jgi:hypothetical protein